MSIACDSPSRGFQATGQPADHENQDIQTVCVVGDSLKNDRLLLDNLKSLNVQVVFSRDGMDVAEHYPPQSLAFILDEFEGDPSPVTFQALNQLEASLFGPTAIREIAARRMKLVSQARPLFCMSMEGMGICFNNYRRKNKDNVRKHFTHIQNMGGSILKDVSTARLTHLIADNCRGEKYRYASTFGIPIMMSDWISAAWEMRHKPGFRADSKEFMAKYKVRPFHGSCIYFLGFAEEEKSHMVSELLRNGGQECLDMNHLGCTHIVVDDDNLSAPLADLRLKNQVLVVKGEWFWASIQMDSCADESHYLPKDYNDTDYHKLLLSPCENNQNKSLFSPGSQSLRKRKRRKEAITLLAQNDPILMSSSSGSYPNKRRSSVSELAMLSMSGSFMDTPDKTLSPLSIRTSDSNLKNVVSNVGTPIGVVQTPTKATIVDNCTPATSAAIEVAKMDLKTMTARQQVFHELVQTETNYVGILKTILDVFKKPLDDPNIKGGQLLNQTEIKIIFGYLPPIYDIHSRMLEEFQSAIQSWRDDFLVGRVYLDYAEDLIKAYPPFVNFFEHSKQTLIDCDKSNPRFHAFLKVCQGKPECGRQSLVELMMRPVQRLPSVMLLLNDLLKHTRKEKDHKDVAALETALSKIKEVLTYINEDKRKTEGQVHIFEIFSDIENCPPHLVSSHRSFICKIDLIELGSLDQLCGKGYELTMFLFSDVLEISKKRSGSKGLGLRSPSTMSLRSVGTVHSSVGSANVIGQASNPVVSINSAPKSLKHITLMNLTAIKRVVDVTLADDVSVGNVFAMVCRNNQELKERMFVFQIVSSDDYVDKITFLKQLCRQIANTMFRPDPATYYRQMKAEDLGLEPSDLSLSHFGSRAYRTLQRKVNRTFSLNRTPTGARLKRAVSSIISPVLIGGGAGNSNSSTSSNCSVSQMRFAPLTPSGSESLLGPNRLSSYPNVANCSELSLMSPVFADRNTSPPNLTTSACMPPPSIPPLHFPATPKRGMVSMMTSSPSLSLSDKEMSSSDQGFRTPTFVSRRPSFNLKAAASSLFSSTKK